ncbi:MAG: tetratricopeptide repeat protein [Ruminococcus sp.]|nr:tetratricopeptide repeat protein [Ruminococcus sp.]
MKNKLKFIIPIAIAVIAIIVAALCINFTPAEKVDISSLVSTAQKYLIENNYEQAIAEFNKIIEIDPMNVDAYIGIADAYIGMGDTEKAIEWLEKGYELTGDERLKNMIDELNSESSVEDLTITTQAETENTTEIITETTEVVDEEAEEIKQLAYNAVISQFDGYCYGEPNTFSYVYIPYRWMYAQDTEYISIKIEYGANGEWIKETYLKDNILTINERQFTGDTYMECIYYNLENNEMCIPNGWHPSSDFSWSTVMGSFLSEYKINEKNINKYTYGHVYDTYYDMLYHVYIEDEKINKIEYYRGSWYETSVFEYDTEEKNWVYKEYQYGGSYYEYYPYLNGLPNGIDENIFNVKNDKFKLVDEDTFKHLNY